MPPLARPKVPLTLNDLVHCGWRDIVVGTIEGGYSSAWHPLSHAARTASEEGDEGKSRALWALADACSMMLVPTSSTAPFQASVQMQTGRSALPDDFSADELEVLGEFVAQVDEPWMRARLADLVWFQRRPRARDMLFAAIDAYRSVPPTKELWLAGADEGWRRALALVRMAGSGAEARAQEMESALLSALDNAGEESRWKLRLAQLIFDTGLAEDRRPEIAECLVEVGTRAGLSGDGFLARDAFALARNFFKRLRDKARNADMGLAIAESWVADANAKVGRNRGNTIAASFFENAIQAFRTVPRGERARLNIETRLHQVQAQLGEAGALAVAEMTAISTPSIDIRELIDHSRTAVSGKEPLAALKAFALLYLGPNTAELRKQAEASAQRFVLSGLFGTTSLSRDGRVIARQAGGNLGGGGGSEEQLLASMIRDHQIMVSLVIQGQMLPAIDILRAEHNFTLQDFVNLAGACPLIPPGREVLVGKGLLAGLNGDFDVALHIISPQVEHFVRYHLKQAGILTTRVDPAGIENEIGLSSLMDLPGVDDVLSANLTFEIRATFCNPHGPNLRNDVAHGLLDDDQANSLPSAYAWWMIFRLVFVSWWNSRRPATPEGSTDGTSDKDESVDSDLPHPNEKI